MTDARTDAARRRYDELYERSLNDSDAFWLEAAERLDWTRGPERALELRERSRPRSCATRRSPRQG